MESKEFITADGEVASTGFGNVKRSRLSDLCKNGVGPNLQELFIQSNIGIVTKITIWLCRKPEYFRTISFSLGEEHSLANVLDRLKVIYGKWQINCVEI